MSAERRLNGESVQRVASMPCVQYPLGYQQITSLSGSTPLTVPSGARVALIQPEVQAVRWRDGGAAPTASVGMPLAASDKLFYDGDLASVRFIQQTAGAILNVSYYA